MGSTGNGGVATSVGRDQLTLREWADIAAAEIADAYDPQAIYLFGSVARGDNGAGSDIDILVVFDERQDIPEMHKPYLTAYDATHIDCDVLLTNLAHFEQDKLRPWHVAHQVAKEGIQLYQRQARIPEELYMHPLPPDELEDAEVWLGRARKDLRGAERFLEDEDEGNARYHAQQAAEKSLKALFIAEKRRFPATHKLADLFDELPGSYADLFDRERLRCLSPWAVGGRYPDDMPDYAMQPAEVLMDTAKTTLETVEDVVRSLRLQRATATTTQPRQEIALKPPPAGEQDRLI